MKPPKLPKLKMTPEEQAILEFCGSTLTEDQIRMCRAQAKENAIQELYGDDGCELLSRTMAEILVRHVRAERLRGIRRFAASRKRKQ